MEPFGWKPSDHRVLKAPKDRQELRVWPGLQEFRAQQAHKARQDLPERMELPGRTEQSDLLVRPDHRELQEQQDPSDLPVPTVRQELQEPRDPRVVQGLRARPDRPAQQVP